jgi:hypothetical protein
LRDTQLSEVQINPPGEGLIGTLIKEDPDREMTARVSDGNSSENVPPQRSPTKFEPNIGLHVDRIFFKIFDDISHSSGKERDPREHDLTK